MQPWAERSSTERVSRPLRFNGEPYHGVNVLVLWSEASANGYASPRWLTFRQALQLGACVRKGEHGTPVFYTNRVARTVRDEAGDETERTFSLLRSYTVLNAEQITGLPDPFYVCAGPVGSSVEKISAAEAFFQNVGATTIHGGSDACYIPARNRIHLPCIDAFESADRYYSTRGHENVHWTAHSARLNRTFDCKRWGDKGYAMEELVAEVGAAFLCADLSINCEPRADHASYIDHWLRALRQDKRAIFTAASHAQRACDYLHSLQPQASTEDEQAASLEAGSNS